MSFLHILHLIVNAIDLTKFSVVIWEKHALSNKSDGYALLFFHPLLRFFFFKLMKSMVLHRGSYFCATDEKKYQKKSTVKVDSMSVLFHARSLNEYIKQYYFDTGTIPFLVTHLSALFCPDHHILHQN